MFPVNEGDAWSHPNQPGNGDGRSYVAISFSCDGYRWAPLIKLVGSRGLWGRTYEHPVDGFVQVQCHAASAESL